MSFSRTFALALAVVAVGAGHVGVDAQNGRGRGNQSRGAAIRFQAMDQNGDRTISRAEWRGSDRSFKVHDWNADGKLSGEEIRVGGSRGARAADPNVASSDREYVFDDWTDRGFRTLDDNNDGRLARGEWHFDREGFQYLDRNNDGIVSRAEFLPEADNVNDRDERVQYSDVNLDGRISRSEWHGAVNRFAALDVNRDGFLSRQEVLGNEPPINGFTSVDRNRDRVITLEEWNWSRAIFDQRDLNRDGRLSVQEFDGTAAVPNRSSAWRTGNERGQIEGRQAGREERLNNRAWDLEGQSELDNADSGYQPGMGPKADFQAGYREGFRRAYGEGWNEAK